MIATGINTPREVNDLFRLDDRSKAMKMGMSSAATRIYDVHCVEKCLSSVLLN